MPGKHRPKLYFNLQRHRITGQAMHVNRPWTAVCKLNQSK
jgi:hypothetical protein